METYDGNLVNSVKDSCSQHRAKYVEAVLSYVDTPLTMREIAKEIGCSYHCVRDIMMLLPDYETRVFNNRSAGRAEVKYLSGKDNGNYKGHQTTHCGYICWKKPTWYTGNKSTGDAVHYVFEHVLIMCTELGVSELPNGYVVHHIDECKQNNSLSNLALMTRSHHIKLHSLLRKGVTTIPVREYTQVGGSARLFSFNTKDEEIVCSNQQWLAAT